MSSTLPIGVIFIDHLPRLILKIGPTVSEWILIVLVDRREPHCVICLHGPPMLMDSMDVGSLIALKSMHEALHEDDVKRVSEVSMLLLIKDSDFLDSFADLVSCPHCLLHGADVVLFSDEEVQRDISDVPERDVLCHSVAFTLSHVGGCILLEPSLDGVLEHMLDGLE